MVNIYYIMSLFDLKGASPIYNFRVTHYPAPGLRLNDSSLNLYDPRMNLDNPY
jgi:hypothetical protein